VQQYMQQEQQQQEAGDDVKGGEGEGNKEDTTGQLPQKSKVARWLTDLVVLLPADSGGEQLEAWVQFHSRRPHWTA
jgi:hypothetical protein